VRIPLHLQQAATHRGYQKDNNNRRYQMEQISFVSACVRFFGCLEGQSKLDLGREIKALTDADRSEMKPELESCLGVTIA
jgi:hypothetical protein